MPFEVLRSESGAYASVVLKDATTNSSVEIYSFGALLNSFTVPFGNGFLNVIDGFSSIADAIENITPFFKSAKLSPYVCRVKHAAYSFEQSNYLLGKYTSNGNALHGLIYDASFDIVELSATDTAATVLLQTVYDNGLQGFPHKYKCEVRYTLFAENKLTVTTTITNLHQGNIPVTDGWHPYFTLGDTINDYEVSFSSIDLVEFDEALIPTGNMIPYDVFVSPRNFGPTFFDNCFTLNMETEQPKCVIKNPLKNIQVEFYPETSYPYLQFYTPDTRKSIAIENLSALPDAFNNGIGLKILKAGESADFSVSFVVRSL